MKDLRPLPTFLLAAALALALAACSDDDDDGPLEPDPTIRTFTVTVTNVSPDFLHFASGVFDTPVGESVPAPIGPGQAYEVRFGAARGDMLSFATMMVQSNDLFYAPSAAGIELYPSGVPIDGEITGQILLWDAGTEDNEEPGVGEDQAPRQTAPDTGPLDPDPNVRHVDDGFTYPEVSEVLTASIEYHGGGEFTLRLENVSDETTLHPSTGPSVSVPLAPGVYVVHQDPEPLFSPGEPEPGDGLEALAEDGDPAALADTLDDRSGLDTPLSPGVFAVHDSGRPLFSLDQNSPVTLESLAEDGDPAPLAEYATDLASVGEVGVFSTPQGQANPGPAVPGASYDFQFDASPGDRLSLVTMFVESNDLFYAFDDVGLALFTVDDEPVTGDVSDALRLWDAGTEVNQWPGAGPDQQPRQAEPGIGDPDPDPDVRTVDDGYSYPETTSIIQVTLGVD